MDSQSESIWLFYALHCSFFHKKSSCAKFGSIIRCIVMEDLSRIAAGSNLLYGSFINFQPFGFCGSLWNTPLVCCVCFFPSVSRRVTRNFLGQRSFFWNSGTSINNHLENEKQGPRREKNPFFSLGNSLKLRFKWEI